MNEPDCIETAEGYSRFCPLGRVSLQQGIDRVSKAIAFARENRIRKLLVDTTQLTGFKSPGTWERFFMAERFAYEARSSVIVVFIAKAEHIDPERFGITVARNRGLLCNVFTSEAEALAWLLSPCVN